MGTLNLANQCKLESLVLSNLDGSPILCWFIRTIRLLCQMYGLYMIATWALTYFWLMFPFYTPWTHFIPSANTRKLKVSGGINGIICQKWVNALESRSCIQNILYRPKWHDVVSTSIRTTSVTLYRRFIDVETKLRVYWGIPFLENLTKFLEYYLWWSTFNRAPLQLFSWDFFEIFRWYFRTFIDNCVREFSSWQIIWIGWFIGIIELFYCNFCDYLGVFIILFPLGSEFKLLIINICFIIIS